MIRSGKLDRRIEITRQVETVAANGHVNKTWAVLHAVKAELVQFDAAEILEGFGEANADSIILKIRYLADFTTADRITFNGAAHDVESISEIGRRRGQLIKAKRIP